MRRDPALPSWLVAALEQAADATLVMRAGEPPYVIKNEAPYHFGTAPLTSGSLEAIAHELLTTDAQKALLDTGSVQLAVEGREVSMSVQADRLDNDLVLRLRRAHFSAPPSGATADVESAGQPASDAHHAAELIAALGAAASNEEAQAAIVALASRLRLAGLPSTAPQTPVSAAEQPVRRARRPESPKTPAPVVDLNRRREAVGGAFEFDDWISEAVGRGARTLYLRAGSVPFIRTDGQVGPLASDVVPLSMLERAGAAMTAERDGWRRTLREWEWAKHLGETGTIRCQAFVDTQGGGFVVHLPVSAASGFEQVVPLHVRAACETGDGVVVIAAPFTEDVAAMVEAVVAWNSKRRAGYVVGFGSGGGLEVAAPRAFVSERPLPETDHEMAAAIRGALREAPDVLVVAGETGHIPACDAIVSAAVGRLVIVGVVARTAPLALGVLLKNLIDPPARQALAGVFRSACSWRGIRRPGARRLVLSDVLVGTEHVADLIRAADIDGLHLVQRLEQDGMRSVDAVLSTAVTRGRITLRDAAACAVDRKLLVSLVLRKARERRAAASATTGHASDRRPATVV